MLFLLVIDNEVMERRTPKLGISQMEDDNCERRYMKNHSYKFVFLVLLVLIDFSLTQYNGTRRLKTINNI